MMFEDKLINNIINNGMRLHGRTKFFLYRWNQRFHHVEGENHRFSSSKGVNQFIAATLLILVGIVTAMIVSAWVVNISSERTSTVVNRTQSQLACQYASMYVSNVTFDCNSNCFTGVPYRINATIENSGNTRLDVYNLFISLTDGSSYRIDSNGTVISTGSVLTKNFNDILIRSPQRIPSETMDTRRAYGNDSNTTGLWHFDEGSGSSTADSAKNNTGTLYNGTTVCAGLGTCPLWNGSGRFSRTLTFDGINDLVNLTNLTSVNVTGNLTLEVWINMRDVTKSNQRILTKGDNANNIQWDLRFDGTTGNILFGLKNSTRVTNLSSATALSNSAWYHIAATYDGVNMKIYINGRQDAATAQTGPIIGLSLPILVGSHSGASPEFLNGTVDEVRISNISRTFNTTLTYDIVHPSISAVRVYNESGVQIDAQTGLSGGTYSRNITNITTATDYRVEVTDSTGAVLEKWYPARSGCRARSTLDKITFTTANCPELTDTYYGTDVFFVTCAP